MEEELKNSISKKRYESTSLCGKLIYSISIFRSLMIDAPQK